jgi:hypothetical protein
VTERTSRPSGQYTGAAVERVPNELPDNPAGEYRLRLVDEPVRSKAADDIAAELEEMLAAAKDELEERLAAGKAPHDFPEPAPDNKSDSRGDDSV